MRLIPIAALTLAAAAAACAPPAATVVTAANPFTVPVSVTRAGSNLYDSLRACGQPGVDLSIGLTDQITTAPFEGPFAGLRLTVAPAAGGALVTVANVPATPALLGRIAGWAVRGPDC